MSIYEIQVLIEFVYQSIDVLFKILTKLLFYSLEG